MLTYRETPLTWVEPGMKNCSVDASILAKNAKIEASA